VSKLCAVQLCHVITFRVPGGHIGEDRVAEVAARPVLRDRSVLGEDLAGGDVAPDEPALVDGEACPLRRRLRPGKGETAGEVKRGEDEEQKQQEERREEGGTEAGPRRGGGG
jgi:hypothetical protein